MVEIIRQEIQEIIDFTPELVATLLFFYLVGYMFLGRNR
jgi:hypothetical protein